MKGITSSPIPNTEPPIEKSVIKMGINNFLTAGEVECAFAIAFMPESTASVFVKTPNAPPTINTKPIIKAASTNPSIGAVSMSKIP